MPLLVDRPLHSFATIGGAAALTTATNFNTPSGGGCVLLVDCLGNDGAVVDSISIIANEASTTASKVLVFLSVSGSAASITSANTVCVANVEGSRRASQANEPTSLLPPLSIPVPNLGALTQLLARHIRKNTGLYVPSGATLYVGVTAALTAPSSATRVHVFCPRRLLLMTFTEDFNNYIRCLMRTERELERVGLLRGWAWKATEAWIYQRSPVTPLLHGTQIRFHMPKAWVPAWPMRPALDSRTWHQAAMPSPCRAAKQ